MRFLHGFGVFLRVMCFTVLAFVTSNSYATECQNGKVVNILFSGQNTQDFYTQLSALQASNSSNYGNIEKITLGNIENGSNCITDSMLSDYIDTYGGLKCYVAMPYAATEYCNSTNEPGTVGDGLWVDTDHHSDDMCFGGATVMDPENYTYAFYIGKNTDESDPSVQYVVLDAAGNQSENINEAIYKYLNVYQPSFSYWLFNAEGREYISYPGTGLECNDGSSNVINLLCLPNAKYLVSAPAKTQDGNEYDMWLPITVFGTPLFSPVYYTKYMKHEFTESPLPETTAYLVTYQTSNGQMLPSVAYYNFINNNYVNLTSLDNDTQSMAGQIYDYSDSAEEFLDKLMQQGCDNCTSTSIFAQYLSNDGSPYSNNPYNIDLSNSDYTDALRTVTETIGYEFLDNNDSKSSIQLLWVNVDPEDRSLIESIPNSDSSINQAGQIYGAPLNSEQCMDYESEEIDTFSFASYAPENNNEPVITYDNYVVFDANGGIGNMASQGFVNGSNVTLNQNTLTHANHENGNEYMFIGWNTAADRTGTWYENGATLEDLTGTITLYAQWEELKFTLTTSETDSFDFDISAAGTFVVDCGANGTLISTTNDVSGNKISRTNESSNTTYTCSYTGTTTTHTIRFGGEATGYSTAATGYSTNIYASTISFYTGSNYTNKGNNAKKITGIAGSLGAIFHTIEQQQPRFKDTFHNASNMTGTIPSNLFAGVHGAPVYFMFDSTFSGCSGLTGSIPETLFCQNPDNPDATNCIYGAPANGMFVSTFSSCSGLTGSIPAGLFAGIHGAPANYMFDGTFFGCSGLTGSIPETLFCQNPDNPDATNCIYGAPASYMFDNTFSSCSGLTGSIPAGLFAGIHGAPANYMFNGTFFECNRLTGSIPETLFCQNPDNPDATNCIYGAPQAHMFSLTFYACSGLTGSIPSGLFSGIHGAPATFMFDGTFNGCRGLTGSIPETLFCQNTDNPDATNCIYGAPQAHMFSATFSSCSGLTGSIPAGLFAGIHGAPQDFIFSDTFSSCSGLTGSIPETLFCQNPDNPDATNCIYGAPTTFMFFGTFRGCSGLTGSIPSGLFAGIYGDPANHMFANTFSSCSNINGIGNKSYVPTSFLSDITDDTSVSDQVSTMFYNTGLLSSCPAGTYTTTRQQFSDAWKPWCGECPVEYPNSVSGANSIDQCYKSCDIACVQPTCSIENAVSCEYDTTVANTGVEYYNVSGCQGPSSPICPVSDITCAEGFKKSGTAPNLTCESVGYNITYYNGNETLSTGSYTYSPDSQTVTPTEPTISNATFIGWCDNAELTGDCPKTITINGSVADNLSYYAKYTCDAGYYKSGNVCVHVEDGYYSPSGTNERYSCSEQAGSTYTHSGNTYSSVNDCYKPCTIAHADSVRGNDYYGTGIDTCELLHCEIGYIEKLGITSLRTEIGDIVGLSYGYIDNNGESGEQAVQLGLTESNSWIVNYGNGKKVAGMAACSSTSGKFNWNYPQQQLNEPITISSDIPVEFVSGGYCWCNMTGYTFDGGTLEEISSPWIYNQNFGGPGTCSNNCSAVCARLMFYDNNGQSLAFRKSLFNSVAASSCEPATYNIVFYDGGVEINRDTYTYGENKTISYMTYEPTKENARFVGWCDNPGIDNGCAVTRYIQSGDYGDKKYYARFACNEGYTLEQEPENNIIAKNALLGTNAPTGTYGWIDNAGDFGTYSNNDNDKDYYWLDNNDHNSFTVKYNNDAGALQGHGYCSTTAGVGGPYMGSSSVFSTQINIDDETGQDGAYYCWCKADKYITPDSNTSYDLNTLWTYNGNYSSYDNPAESCASNCVKICANYLGWNDNGMLALRKTVLSAQESTSCVPATYDIEFYDQSIKLDNTGSYTYSTESQTVTPTEPTKENATFVGWCDNRELTGNCQKNITIAGGTTGVQKYYAKFECIEGYTESGTSNIPDLMTLIGLEENGVDRAYKSISDNGSSLNAELYGLTNGQFLVDYGEKGKITGHAQCSLTEGRLYDKADTSETISDEENGWYCWCHLDSYTPKDGQRQDLSSLWTAVGVIGPGGTTYSYICRENCVSYCSRIYYGSEEPAYKGDVLRKAMFEGVQAPASTCELQEHTVLLYSDDSVSSIYTRYNTGVYSDINLSELLDSENAVDNLPTKQGYVFDGYYSEQNGGIQYIDANGYITTAGQNAALKYTDDAHIWYAHWTTTEFTCPGGMTLHLGNAKTCMQETRPSSRVVLVIKKGNKKYYLSATPNAEDLPVSATSDTRMKMLYKGNVYNLHDSTVRADN